MRQHGPALEYASEGLRAEREVVLAAVAQDQRALKVSQTQPCVPQISQTYGTQSLRACYCLL